MANAPNDDRSRSFEEAVWQFLDAQLRSTAPDVEELVREYPEFEDRIRQKVDEFQKVDSLFDSLVQAEASDFDAAVMAHDLTDRKTPALAGAYRKTDLACTQFSLLHRTVPHFHGGLIRRA